MKYLAVILALIIGTPSIAYAGELDGKALACTYDKQKSINNKGTGENKYITFKNGQIYHHFLSTLTPIRIIQSKGLKYRAYSLQINWSYSESFYVLNRSTLELTWSIIGINLYYNCALIKEKTIKLNLTKELDRIKDMMKKNKI